MIEVFDILDKIGNTSSRNEKEAILKANINNEELKKVLEYTYNPFKVYGIGVKAFNSKTMGLFAFSKINTIFDLLDYLLAHNTGTDEDKMKVNFFINTSPISHREWLKKIILKDLKIGITETTINKIWKGLVPTFTVQLAEPFEKFFNNVAAEVKIDGVRCLTIKQNGIVTMFTRNGKLLEGFDDIAKQIKDLEVGSIVFDGEIIGKDYTDTMNNLFTKKTDKKAHYMIFDCLTPEEFFKGESKFDYSQRKHMLKNIENIAKGCTNLVFIQPMKLLSNPTLEQLNELTNQAVAIGYEGIVIKSLDSRYKNKRTTDWQKMKPFFSDEFKIIGFETGTGKNANTLGKVLIDVKGTTVGVGSGFSDAQRNEIWTNQNDYLGKLIEVQYQEIIPKTGSLRFPTVKSLRLDK